MHRRHLHFSTGETRSLFQHSRDAKPSLLSPACPDCPLLRREVESLRPPGSGEVICCLAGFLGESRDSGLRLGLDAWADNGISSGASRTVRGKSRDPLPFSRSGLIMGDFARREEPRFRVRRTAKILPAGRREAVTRNEMIAKKCLR